MRPATCYAYFGYTSLNYGSEVCHFDSENWPHPDLPHSNQAFWWHVDAFFADSCNFVILSKARAIQLAMDANVATRMLQNQLGHSPCSPVTFHHYCRCDRHGLARPEKKPLEGLDWASLAVQKRKNYSEKSPVVGLSRRKLLQQGLSDYYC